MHIPCPQRASRQGRWNHHHATQPFHELEGPRLFSDVYDDHFVQYCSGLHGHGLLGAALHCFGNGSTQLLLVVVLFQELRGRGLTSGDSLPKSKYKPSTRGMLVVVLAADSLRQLIREADAAQVTTPEPANH